MRNVHAVTTQNIQSPKLTVGLCVILLITPILALFGGYQYYTTFSLKTTELRNIAEHAVAKLAENLVIPLWNHDEPPT